MRKIKKNLCSVFLSLVLLLCAFASPVLAASSSTSSLTPDKTVTIQAQTAIDFGGTDYKAKLSGNIYYASKTSSKWAVLIHGFSGTGQKMANAVGQMYLDEGFNVFAMDLRGWGNSEGTSTMGYIESLDVWDWLTYLNENYDCEEIIVHGVSLGGATTAYLSGQKIDGKTLKSQNVIGLVEDCGYASMTGVISSLLDSDYASSMGLDKTGLDSSDEEGIRAYLIDTGYSGLTEENFDELQCSTSSLAKSSTPILFVHGTEDSMVPYSNYTKLLNVAKKNTAIEYIQKYEADGEDHAFIMSGKNASTYSGHVSNFITEAEKVAAGKTVVRISDYPKKTSLTKLIVAKTLKNIVVIKNFGS